MCDTMLGKLCRYLRIMGIDSGYIKVGEGNQKIVLARKENRILLTRNSKLRELPEVFFITSDTADAQLKEVAARYNLDEGANFFTRCLLCNDELLDVKKEDVAGKVPFYTYKHFKKFARCPNCARIYWEGSHHKNMKKKLEAILASSKK